MVANSWCQVTNSLFKLVGDLKILKFGNEFRFLTQVCNLIHDMQVPELGYKPFKECACLYFSSPCNLESK